MRRLLFAMALASLAVVSGCTVPSEEMASENEPAATSPPKIYQVDSVAIKSAREAWPSHDMCGGNGPDSGIHECEVGARHHCHTS